MATLRKRSVGLMTIKEWLEMRHEDVNYTLTQFFKGIYPQYLYKFKLNVSPDCPKCNGILEDLEHALSNIRGKDTIPQEPLGKVLPDNLLR